jgi:hypothetical protein
VHYGPRMIGLSALSMLSGLSSIAFTSAAVAVVTSGGTIDNLEACGYHPFIDYDLLTVSTTPSTTAITGATIVIIGQAPTDLLLIDPNPAVLSTTLGCYDYECPCIVEGITLSAPPTPGGFLTLTGTASAAAYTSCLRRIFLASTAFGGEEVLGRRMIRYSVVGNDGSIGIGENFVRWIPPNDPLCGTYVSSRIGLSVGATSGSYLACPDCPPRDLILFPEVTVTTPIAALDPFFGLVGSAVATFYPFSRVPLPPAFPDEDRLWVRPDPSIPGSTCTNPCPGLRITHIVATDGSPTGLRISGAATPDVYTSCARRLIYFNLAGTPTPGERPIGITFNSVIRSQSTTSFGATRFFNVSLLGPDSCTVTTVDRRLEVSADKDDLARKLWVRPTCPYAAAICAPPCIVTSSPLDILRSDGHSKGDGPSLPAPAEEDESSSITGANLNSPSSGSPDSMPGNNPNPDPFRSVSPLPASSRKWTPSPSRRRTASYNTTVTSPDADQQLANGSTPVSIPFVSAVLFAIIYSFIY